MLLSLCIYLFRWGGKKSNHNKEEMYGSMCSSRGNATDRKKDIDVVEEKWRKMVESVFLESKRKDTEIAHFLA